MFTIILILVFVVAVMTGFTHGGKNEGKITFDNVSGAIQAEGPKLISKGQVEDQDALNGVKPYLFDIADANNIAKPESIYVYIFDSEQAMKEGIKKQHYTITTLTALKNYEQNNALVVYIAKGGNIQKFGDKIQMAVQKL
jgi:hypothetical protein